MGLAISKVWSLFAPKRPPRVLVVGLDDVGKTSLLYYLMRDKKITHIPVIGGYTHEEDYRGMQLVSWDMGGQDKIRPLWRHYYENTAGIVFMVNSIDRGRIDDSDDAVDSAKENLHRLLSDPLLGARAEADGLNGLPSRPAPPLLILATKQDLPNAMSGQEISERLDVNILRARRQCFVQTCSTLEPDLLEAKKGLDWMLDAITNEQ